MIGLAGLGGGTFLTGMDDVVFEFAIGELAPTLAVSTGVSGRLDGTDYFVSLQPARAISDLPPTYRSMCLPIQCQVQRVLSG